MPLLSSDIVLTGVSYLGHHPKHGTFALHVGSSRASTNIFPGVSCCVLQSSLDSIPRPLICGAGEKRSGWFPWSSNSGSWCPFPFHFLLMFLQVIQGFYSVVNRTRPAIRPSVVLSGPLRLAGSRFDPDNGHCQPFQPCYLKPPPKLSLIGFIVRIKLFGRRYWHLCTICRSLPHHKLTHAHEFTSESGIDDRVALVPEGHRADGYRLTRRPEDSDFKVGGMLALADDGWIARPVAEGGGQRLISATARSITPMS